MKRPFNILGAEDSKSAIVKQRRKFPSEGALIHSTYMSYTWKRLQVDKHYACDGGEERILYIPIIRPSQRA